MLALEPCSAARASAGGALEALEARPADAGFAMPTERRRSAVYTTSSSIRGRGELPKRKKAPRSYEISVRFLLDFLWRGIAHKYMSYEL